MGGGVKYPKWRTDDSHPQAGNCSSTSTALTLRRGGRRKEEEEEEGSWNPLGSHPISGRSFLSFSFLLLPPPPPPCDMQQGSSGDARFLSNIMSSGLGVWT